MWWIAGVCAICLFLCLPFFLHYKKNLRFKLAAAFKVCGTLCAAVFALIAAIRLDPRCWICFAALILHATADYFLEFSLYIGAGFFLAGHICYIAFFTSIFPPTAVHLICAVCLLATMGYMFFFRWRKQIGKQATAMGKTRRCLPASPARMIKGKRRGRAVKNEAKRGNPHEFDRTEIRRQFRQGRRTY